jgi:hypothetical protein
MYQFLVSKGADPDQLDATGRMGLFLDSTRNDTTTALLLVEECGANSRLSGRELGGGGLARATDLAILHGNVILVSSLLAHDAVLIESRKIYDLLGDQ